jgi:uncharacterized coiled-coil DUF342 family protein
MNRPLRYVNFVGVLALAVLCVIQWRTNRELNLEVGQLEKARLEQSAKLAQQEQAIQGCASDLDRFREQLSGAKATLRKLEAKLGKAEHEAAQAGIERDQLKVSVTNWANAIALRDERLKKATDELQKLITERSDVVAKFNELAEKYNEAVNDLNARTKDYNALVERYNALAKSSKNTGSE